MTAIELRARIKAAKQRYWKARQRQAIYLGLLFLILISMVGIKKLDPSIDIYVPELINFDADFFELDDFAKNELKYKK